MAVLDTSTLAPVPELVAQLKRCAGAVVRLAGKAQGSYCTGWVLTPHLVIVPGYAISMFTDSNASASDRTEVRVESYSDGEVAWSSVVDEPELLGKGGLSKLPEVWTIALLKTEFYWEGPVLEFSLDAPFVDEEVALFQFAGGKPPPSVSFGRIRSAAHNILTYDASSVVGSGGSPIIDRDWRVAGIHFGAYKKLNVGLPRQKLLQVLHSSASWPEIAEAHRIADSATALQQLENTKPEIPAVVSTSPSSLVWAALVPSLNPKKLTEAERGLLSPLVIDANSMRWVLRLEQRRELLRSAGAFANLRTHLRASETQDMASRVVQAVLKGPPYNFSKTTEDELAWWLQISRWFEGLIPGLPKPGAFGKMLAIRGIRAPLERVAGSDFKGRAATLRRLSTWFRHGKGPVLLTGIGGVGKSALIARFALSRPRNALILWLDFDRADLAPDDPVSILSAIARQASAQLELSTTPLTSAATWKAEATALGKQIAARLGRKSALLVLDSFEAAQYAANYHAIWEVLEAVGKPFRGLRLAVVGRASVPHLKFRGRAAMPISLDGLLPGEATALLRARGIANTKATRHIVKLADGVPLILHLAVRYAQSGQDLTAIPKALPQEVITGYLYDRILDRLQRPEIRDLVRGALVLRRVTTEMLKPVLHGLVTLPEGEPEDWYQALASEMSLVEGTQILTLRPEVRRSTLKLLEQEKPEWVRSIDERAAQWYNGLTSKSAADNAELVYHLLRLGNVAGAESAWHAESAPLLSDSPEEIHDAAARSWLEKHIQNITQSGPSLAQWEQEAYSNILSVRARRLERNVGRILKQRAQRTDGSPLIFQDAFELRRNGKRSRAANLLDEAAPATGTIERDRSALRALLASEADDRLTADAHLQRIDSDAAWKEKTNGAIYALCVQAARIWIRTDLGSESKLVSQLRGAKARRRARSVLAPLDVVLPQLRQLLSAGTTSLDRSGIELDVADSKAIPLAQAVDQQRGYILRHEWKGLTVSQSEPTGPRDRASLVLEPQQRVDRPSDREKAIARIAQLGLSRWEYTGSSEFISKASSISNASGSQSAAMEIALLGTLALFSASAGDLRIAFGGRSIGDIILENYVLNLPWKADVKDWTLIKRLLKTGVDPDFNWDALVRRSREKQMVLFPKRLIARGVRREKGRQGITGLGPYLLALVSRDPLTQLVSELAGEQSGSMSAVHE